MTYTLSGSIAKSSLSRLGSLFVAAGTITALTGCSALQSQNSPDVIYSTTAVEARALQVPPDLTDVSDAEQFVLPGTPGAAVTRNTLLPQFDNAVFVRDGGQSWLEFTQTPEDLWPLLLSFARAEGYRIDRTEPVAGLVVTQWGTSSADGNTGLLGSLVAGGEKVSRIAFRLERAGAESRLFARSQSASKAAIESQENTEDASWPASSHNPENTSALLQRFLVFLGVEEQKARGILSEAQARAALDNATVRSNASGSELIINRSYRSSFNQLLSVIQQLDGYTLTSSDDSLGRIEVQDATTSVVLELSPIHVSAVSVSLVSSEGARLPIAEEQQLLSLLARQLA